MPKIAPMKKFRIRIVVALLMAWLLMVPPVLPAQGKETFPAPTGAVNDFAGVIPAEYQQRMSGLAEEVLQKTGVAIVVATFPDIGDNAPEDFVNRLYQAWGIGRKGEDKGVLIFVAVKQRKFRIETGYGVEGILPDGLVGEIRDRYAIPNLRRGDYGEGLFRPMLAIAQTVTGNSVTPSEPAGSRDRRETARQQKGSGLFGLLFLLVILPFLLFTRTGRWFLLGLLMSGGRGGGGGFGGFGGGGFGGFGGGSSGGGGAGGSY